MHLACGISLRSTVAQAKASGIVDIADVRLFNHFRKCNDFFKWCITELLKENINRSGELFGNLHKWKAVDESLVHEPGQTGTHRRIHYSLNLADLSEDQVLIIDFNVSKGDVFIPEAS